MADAIKSLELVIFTVSDSSGETAEAVAKAALVQFPPGKASIYRLPQIRSSEQLTQLMEKIATTHPSNALIAYTLVLPEYHQTLVKEADKHKIPNVDILGFLISGIATLTNTVPLSQPGRLHLLDETYFKRIEAVDFAMRFDDGKNPNGIEQADIVLVGVSRTSKTPSCMYLAHHYGLKAANVPIVDNVEPPKALFNIDPHKIVGLNIDPLMLHQIRVTRAQVLGMPSQSDYADLEKIRHEVRQAKQLFRELKCHVIDVTAKAIEETSSEIYLHLRQ